MATKLTQVSRVFNMALPQVGVCVYIYRQMAEWREREYMITRAYIPTYNAIKLIYALTFSKQPEVD